MAGSVIQLASKGAQDIYLMNNDSDSSFFRSVFVRNTNFAQAPKRLEITGQTPKNNGSSIIKIQNLGDLINCMWLEGTNLAYADTTTGINNLAGTVFNLYIGGQQIDSQTFEFLSEAWQPYLAETYSKSLVINNGFGNTCKEFMPMHFFFCDLNSYLPLLALQYHEVEVRIEWGPNIENSSNIIPYGNYIYLDTKERQDMINKPMELLISQVQRLTFPVTSGVPTPTFTVDLSAFNHPVKTLFFGIEATTSFNGPDTCTFDTAELQINGTTLCETMSPLYCSVIQSFYSTDYAILSWNSELFQPNKTLLYMYNFCLSASGYKPTGTLNFSRLDNAKMIFKNITTSKPDFVVYAVNYNILKIQNGLGGILFGN